jgi:hypothetical protein
MKKELYDFAQDYGALHNEDCCVHFPEDARACDVNTGIDCCENMQMVKGIIDNTRRRVTEFMSHDMEWDSETQRLSAIEMYLEEV